MRRLMPLVLLLLLVPAHARAEIADSSAAGFTVHYAAVVPMHPAAAYDAVVKHVGAWWDKDHTYSGDSRNLSIDVRPGGCFCEKLANGGGVQHLTVVLAKPGELLRLTGGLGPLQQMGVAGAMTWEFAAAEGGTKLEMTYAVGGYWPGGLGAFAPRVDEVLGAQFERARKFMDGYRAGVSAAPR